MRQKLHPELAKIQAIWNQIRILKEEDRAKYATFMLTLPHEKATARKEREPGFIRGFINPSQMLLRAKGDAVYRREVRRQDLSTGQQAFVAGADRSGQSLQEMMQNEVAPSLAAYGTVFAVMDKPRGPFATKAEEIAIGRPYMTVLSPFQAVNFAYGQDGALLWFQYVVDAPVDLADPFNPLRASTWKGDKGLATWTRNTFSVRSLTQPKQFYVPEEPHTLDVVPVIIQSLYVEPNQTIGASTFFTSSDYLIFGNNLENASNQEVFKNADATLTMDIQDWDDEQQPTHERNPDTGLRQLAKEAHEQKNVILFHEHKPEYMSRDLNLIDKAAERAQKYFEMAVDNEKHALSVKSLKAPQSGVSKAYDFQDINACLSTFAAALERFERQAVGMAGDLLDETSEFKIAYPRDFDVRTYAERLEFVKGLTGSGFPSGKGKREAYKTLTPEITSDEKLQAEINAEIDASQPEARPPFPVKPEAP
jgi:hypothetical protein